MILELSLTNNMVVDIIRKKHNLYLIDALFKYGNAQHWLGLLK